MFHFINEKTSDTPKIHVTSEENLQRRRPFSSGYATDAAECHHPFPYSRRKFSRTVINDPHVTLFFDLSGMLRGDFPQVVNSYVNLVRTGITSPDEAREAVGPDRRGD